MDWIIGSIFLISILFVILVAEAYKKKYNHPSEITRKSVHILTGIFIALTPFFFTSNYPLLAIGLLYIPVNIIAIKFGKLKSLHDTTRKSYGTVFYPISFVILTYLLWDHYKTILIASFLLLGLGDAFASIVGKNNKNPLKYTFGGEIKSLQGSLAMFLISTIIVVICLHFMGYVDSFFLPIKSILWIAFITAIVATASEMVSYKGSDNLTVPLGTAFTLHYLISHYPELNSFSYGLILALLIAVISYYLKFLEGGGSVATFLLGVVVFGTGGWKYALPILAFFVLSSILSKIGKKRKYALLVPFRSQASEIFGRFWRTVVLPVLSFCFGITFPMICGISFSLVHWQQQMPIHGQLK